MSETRRVRVQGDLFHGQVPAGAIYMGRACPGLPKSPYCNPFSVKQYGLEEALRLFGEYWDARPELAERAERELRGRELACWCGLDARCHVDMIINRLGNRRNP